VAYLGVIAVGSKLVFQELKRLRGYEKATREDPGLWLRNNTPADARVFVTALEVGYYAKRYMLDSPGLATPRVLQALKENPRLTLFEQAELAKADYVLIPEPAGPPPANFELLRTYRYETKLAEFENKPYTLYKRSEVKGK
jgi:hypothetical protein